MYLGNTADRATSNELSKRNVCVCVCVWTGEWVGNRTTNNISLLTWYLDSYEKSLCTKCSFRTLLDTVSRVNCVRRDSVAGVIEIPLYRKIKRKCLFFLKRPSNKTSGCLIKEILLESLPTSEDTKMLLKPLKTKGRLLYLKTQFVPRSKHFSSRL